MLLIIVQEKIIPILFDISIDPPFDLYHENISPNLADN